LTWKSLPLHFIRGHGWGYLVPYSTDIKVPDAENIPLERLKQLYNNITKQDNCEANVDNAQNSLRDSVETNISFIDCSKSAKRLEVIANVLDKKKLAEASSTDTSTDDADTPREIGFIKLPHKDGEHLNVGNPLSRDFINKFSDNSLAGVDIGAKRIIEISRMLSYWRNNHERVKKQFVVWLNKKDLP
ncbi:DNA polymerase subunit gamma-1, mitochondrial-like, partial [Diaphorina citri]|uniref:DNA polymerase subunit gamma-1, mitochondrial-like n=1 Tax=Diaphorina citri TaxID=121845 RepID=A0A3Q0JKQ6_DIACI